MMKLLITSYILSVATSTWTNWGFFPDGEGANFKDFRFYSDLACENQLPRDNFIHNCGDEDCTDPIESGVHYKVSLAASDDDLFLGFSLEDCSDCVKCVKTMGQGSRTSNSYSLRKQESDGSWTVVQQWNHGFTWYCDLWSVDGSFSVVGSEHEPCSESDFADVAPTYEEVGSGICHDGVPGKSYDSSNDGKWPDASSNPYVGIDWRVGCTRINGKLLCFWRSKVDNFEQCVNFCADLNNCKSFSINPNGWCAPHSETCAAQDLTSHSTMVAYNMMPTESFEAGVGDEISRLRQTNTKLLRLLENVQGN